jgi:hypothetical protein
MQLSEVMKMTKRELPGDAAAPVVDIVPLAPGDGENTICDLCDEPIEVSDRAVMFPRGQVSHAVCFRRASLGIVDYLVLAKRSLPRLK